MTATIIKFNIEQIDSLGQGVFKDDGKIYFIPKTLIGETGTAEVYKSAKGVNFCRLLTLEKKSKERIDSVCPHFSECPGCHFLHTTYENELDIKKQSLLKIFRKVADIEKKVAVVPAKSRIGYRNRLQLHYDLENKTFGFYSTALKKIISVPDCLISNSDVQEKLNFLSGNNAWIDIASESGKKAGHIELYHKKKELVVAVDMPYADGGFTQVNPEMNTELKKVIAENIKEDSKKIIDLFGGDGNLTNDLTDKNIWSIDSLSAQKKQAKNFYTADLFSEDTIASFVKKYSIESVDTIILDPPRSGFKLLKNWCDKFSPKNLIYVSCDPHTLARDLQSVENNYSVEKIILIDLFPSTYHFETVVVLKEITK